MEILCNGEAKNTRNAVEYLKRFKSFDFNIFHDPENLLKRIKRLLKIRSRLIVMGGDGTVNLAVRQMAGTERRLGIVPTGRGNDFAKFLNIPLDPLQALINVQKNNSKRIALGRAGNRYFCNSFGIGFNGYVVALANRYDESSYGWVAVKKFLRHNPFDISLDVELVGGKKKRIEESVLFVAFSNGKTEGSCFRIGGKEDPEYQFLTMTIVKNAGYLERILSFPFLLTSHFSKPRAVESLKVKKVEIKAPHPISKHIDGESFYENVKTVEVADKSVSVLV